MCLAFWLRLIIIHQTPGTKQFLTDIRVKYELHSHNCKYYWCWGTGVLPGFLQHPVGGP